MLLLLILELCVTTKLLNQLSTMYSIVVLIFCVIFFILKLDLLAISLFLVYSSVFLIFFLFYSIYNDKKIKIIDNRLYLCGIFFFIIFYVKFNNLMVRFFWINYFKIVVFKVCQFTSLISILFFKLFYLETIFINIYLTIGLIVSFVILYLLGNKYLMSKKLLFWNKSKRLFRRSNSYNSKLNK